MRPVANIRETIGHFLDSNRTTFRESPRSGVHFFPRRTNASRVRDSAKTSGALIRAAELIEAHLKSADRDKTAIKSKLVRPYVRQKVRIVVVIADTPQRYR